MFVVAEKSFSVLETLGENANLVKPENNNIKGANIDQKKHVSLIISIILLYFFLKTVFLDNWIFKSGSKHN